MASITLDLDDDVLARVAALAESRRTSVAALLAAELDGIGGRIPNEGMDRGHREIVAPLRPEWGTHLSARDRLHDRDLARAETYVGHRERLLRLIDTTEGDLGRQRWDRSKLYDR